MRLVTKSLDRFTSVGTCSGRIKLKDLSVTDVLATMGTKKFKPRTRTGPTCPSKSDAPPGG